VRSHSGIVSTTEYQLPKAHGVRLTAVKKGIAALKLGSSGCQTLSTDQVTVLLRNMSRDAGRFSDKLQKLGRQKTLDSLSQFGMIQVQLLLCKKFEQELCQSLDIIWVQPQMVGFIKGMQWKLVVTPFMYIDSAIQSMKKWGAKGVMFGVS
jgi:hypothetical protein